MQYRTLGKTGWQVGTVGLGCWGIGGQWGEISDDRAIGTIEAAFDHGVNLFDTADAYGIPIGRSEFLIGRALKHRRDQAYIATKVGNWARRMGAPLPYTHPEHVILSCHASLYRLGTDYIDLYQVHQGNLQDPDIYLEALERLVTEGKIRAYGISTDSSDVLRRFDRGGTCATVQGDYSILNCQAEAELLPYAQQANIGVLIRGPLGQGILTGKFDEATRFDDPVRAAWNDGDGRTEYRRQLKIAQDCAFLTEGEHAERNLAQAAIAFTLAHPAVSCAIPGATRPEQAIANTTAADIELSADELQRIRTITAV